MQLEDKELEGPELERETRLEVEEAPRELEETELPAIAGEEVRDIELLHSSRVLDAMQLVLAGADLNLSLLYLPRRETEALQFLQSAVNGRDALGRFVFAEDRGQLLEQALAVLEENITHGDAADLAELESRYAAMTAEIAALRSSITNLEDAQDEIMEGGRAPELVADHADADQPKPSSVAAYLSLTEGPEVAAKPPHVSALDGPEAKRVPHVSTLDGPEPPATTRTSTVSDGGPPAPAKPPHVSTLETGGPEAPDLPPHRSTLGSEG